MNGIRTTGEVWLVGAGPGDPELLTLKALRAIQDADVILYDNLVGDGVLAFARADARRVNVGKIPGGRRARQRDIEALLVEEALAGHRVVRLKGGDPFVFGRGAEEAIACRSNAIPVHIVPGISSALSVPASVGIPSTHRNVSASISVVTGRVAANDGAELEAQWEHLARAGGTLVFLMGIGRVDRIVAALRRAGRSDEEPAAAIRAGTTCDEEVLVASLGTIAEAIGGSGFTRPALLVFGRVVALRELVAEPTLQGHFAGSSTTRTTTIAL